MLTLSYTLSLLEARHRLLSACLEFFRHSLHTEFWQTIAVWKANFNAWLKYSVNILIWKLLFKLILISIVFSLLYVNFFILCICLTQAILILISIVFLLLYVNFFILCICLTQAILYLLRNTSRPINCVSLEVT